MLSTVWPTFESKSTQFLPCEYCRVENDVIGLGHVRNIFASEKAEILLPFDVFSADERKKVVERLVLYSALECCAENPYYPPFRELYFLL